MNQRLAQLAPRRLARFVRRGQSPRPEVDQLRELHGRFSARATVEGELRKSTINEPAGPPAPSLPLTTLVEAFGGSTEPPDVLLFGDSTSLLVSRFDREPQPLVEMIVERLAPLRTCVVAHIAWNGAVQAALLRAVAALGSHPRAVILPMNIRQTTPQWAANPNFQFRELIDGARAFAADPTRGVPTVPPFPRGDLTRSGPADSAAWERFRAVRVGCDWREQKTVGDYLDLIAAAPTSDAERAQRMSDVFAFHWLPGHNPERLEGLTDAVRIADAFGAHIVGQLTPVNHQAGRRLLGPVFDELMEDFTDATTRAARAGATDQERLVLEDLRSLLPSERFFYEDDPTEHFDLAGRAMVADRIGVAVKRALQSNSVR